MARRFVEQKGRTCQAARQTVGSGRGLLGTCVGRLASEMLLQTIEENCLIWVNDPTRPGDLDELRFIDFPGRTSGCSALRRLPRIRVHALLAARVVDVSEIDERTIDVEARFLERFPTRGRLECLTRIRRTFRDAPRRAPVVIPRRMNEENLDRSVDVSVEHRAGRELGACFRHRIFTVQDAWRHCKANQGFSQEMLG